MIIESYYRKMTNKELFEKYPYAFAHNAFTGELCFDDDGNPWSEDENLPEGWKKLFWQCMEDLHDPLEKAGLLNTFYFEQVKEKYATMRLYDNGATEEIHDILGDYEYVSEFVCEKCGKPATNQTTGWRTSYCDDCHKEGEALRFEPIREIRKYSKEGRETIKRDVSNIWNRLYNIKEGDKDND